MSREKILAIKPFLSLIVVILILFMMVFVKMENRRMGYSILKDVRALNKLKDKYKLRKIKYLTLVQPDRVRKIALTHLTLKEARRGQIIQLNGNRLALPQ
ncbi:MAG: hypothetical protein KDD50_15045 [Bdellovibrionales bacterium]|nr:hypothetical protein [Bdellovibrionales bacterium]